MKVESCQKKKDWTNKEGKSVPIYEVVFSGDNGIEVVTAESFGVEIPIGTPLADCTLTDDPKYGKKVKWLKKPGGRGGKSPEEVRKQYRSMSVAFAKDLCVAGKIELKNVTEYARKFNDFINE